jgi:hypothetical protein
MYLSHSTLPDIEMALNLLTDGMVSLLFPGIAGSSDYLTTGEKNMLEYHW